jgi:hypothetical protein
MVLVNFKIFDNDARKRVYPVHAINTNVESDWKF